MKRKPTNQLHQVQEKKRKITYESKVKEPSFDLMVPNYFQEDYIVHHIIPRVFKKNPCQNLSTSHPLRQPFKYAEKLHFVLSFVLVANSRKKLPKVNFFICGGSILHYIIHGSWSGYKGDIDIFIQYNKTMKGLFDENSKIFKKIKKSNKSYPEESIMHVWNTPFKFEGLEIQLIMRSNIDVLQIDRESHIYNPVNNFDLTICQVGYDFEKKRFIFTPGFLKALQTKVTYMAPFRFHTQSRMEKYYKKGYTIIDGAKILYKPVINVFNEHVIPDLSHIILDYFQLDISLLNTWNYTIGILKKIDNVLEYIINLNGDTVSVSRLIRNTYGRIVDSSNCGDWSIVAIFTTNDVVMPDTLQYTNTSLIRSSHQYVLY